MAKPQIYVFFLGSHPDLSAAEIFRVLRSENIVLHILSATRDFIMIQVSDALPKIVLEQLGGTDRVGLLLAEDDKLWDAEDIINLLPSPLPLDKKITIGISIVNIQKQYAQKTGIALKKAVRAKGGHLRFVVATSGTRLNAAQVIFNGLVHSPNHELTFVEHKGKFFLIDTVHVQDIQAYEQRDTARPARDAKIGMLPPKLAQIMVNITASFFPKKPLDIYDPFCGMGAILQEGWLARHKMTGSDLSEAMINASQQNLGWVQKIFQPEPALIPYVFKHDASEPLAESFVGSFDAIVTEPFLGKPLSAPLPKDELAVHVDGLAHFYLGVFKNLRPALKDGGLAFFILPAFRKAPRRNEWERLSPAFLDAINNIGYSKVQLLPQELTGFFEASERQSIIYARPDALVGRELMIWKKI